MGQPAAVGAEAEGRCSVNDDIERHYKPVRMSQQMNAAQKAVLAYNAQQPPLPDIDYYEARRLADAASADLRRRESAARAVVEKQDRKRKKKLKKKKERLDDAADVTLADFLATSSSLWAVTKTRGVCDHYECHEFVIPLAVFKSKKKAEAACLTFAEARAHHDSDVFEVKPMPFFKKGRAA